MLLACLVTWTIAGVRPAARRGGRAATLALGVLRGAGADGPGQGDRLRRGAGRGGGGAGPGLGPRPGDARRLRSSRGLVLAAAVALAWPILVVVAAPVGPGPLDAARRRPPGRAARALRGRARGGSTAPPCSGRPCPGPRWPWSGPGGRWPGPSGRPRRRRPPALGLGGRAGGPALAGDGQERPLRDPRASPLVDLGGPGPGAARRPARRRRGWTPERLRRRGVGRLRGPRPGLRPGLRRARPLARPPRASSGPSTRPPRRILRPGEPLVLLYDDWDRNPYPTPFGPVPHDLAVRLYYLDRPACWRSASTPWPPTAGSGYARPFAVIGRDRDLPGLRRLGRVETVARGPATRFDRTFALFRITPGEWDLAAKSGGRKE